MTAIVQVRLPGLVLAEGPSGIRACCLVWTLALVWSNQFVISSGFEAVRQPTTAWSLIALQGSETSLSRRFRGLQFRSYRIEIEAGWLRSVPGSIAVEQRGGRQQDCPPFASTA